MSLGDAFNQSCGSGSILAHSASLSHTHKTNGGGILFSRDGSAETNRVKIMHIPPSYNRYSGIDTRNVKLATAAEYPTSTKVPKQQDISSNENTETVANKDNKDNKDDKDNKEIEIFDTQRFVVNQPTRRNTARLGKHKKRK